MKWNVLILMLCLSSTNMFGQKGYAQDSLQVKIYANITYENNQSTNIDVKKVFCDYCNETQLKFLREEGLRRAFGERYLPENRLVKGIRRLTIIIRIAKEDFKEIQQ